MSSHVVCDLTDRHVVLMVIAARARPATQKPETARSIASSFSPSVVASTPRDARDDFCWSAKSFFVVYKKRRLRARFAMRAPITWTCSTSAASCPSSRATCARPPHLCGAPCLAARAKRKEKESLVWGERKKKRKNGARRERADGSKRRERAPRAPAAASNPRSRST